MWEMASEKIITEYVRQFSKRCTFLESQERVHESEHEAA